METNKYEQKYIFLKPFTGQKILKTQSTYFMNLRAFSIGDPEWKCTRSHVALAVLSLCVLQKGKTELMDF